MRRILRRRGSERGSALLVATIMIVVTVSMAVALLAPSNAELEKSRSTLQKEAARSNADAGVREAIVWLMANALNLGAWLPDPATVNGTATNAYTTYSGAGDGIGVPPATAVTPAVPAGGRIVTVASLALDPRGFPTGSTQRSNAAGATTGTSRDFLAANLVRFGDPLVSRGSYAYTIIPRGNGYYLIAAEGRALGTSAGGRLYTMSRIQAYVKRQISSAAPPATTTFSNPNAAAILNAATGTTNTGWTNVNGGAGIAAPEIFMRESGGGANKYNAVNNGTIQGNDFPAATQNIAGAAIQNSGLVPGVANPGGSVGGSPGSTNLTGTNVAFTAIDNLVNFVAAASPGAGLAKITWGGTTLGTGTSGLIGNTPAINYVRIPDNTTVNTDIFQLNGNDQLQGIVILDVGTNVRFNFGTVNTAIFKKNGNGGGTAGTSGGLKGGFIFYQRGPITIPATGVYLADLTGNTASRFQWRSDYWGQALSGLGVGFKFASYVVLS